MRKLLLTICLFASVGAMAQNSPKTAQPTAVTGNSFNKPLVLLDGVKYDGDINLLDSKSIAEMTVLNTKELIKRYGEEGKNGVILITTRAAAAKADSLAVKDSSAVKTGATVFTASAEPIYIVDGLKTDATKAKAIDPKNIDRMEILKDAAAATLYGTNSGVIKITTKAAAKKEKSKIKF